MSELSERELDVLRLLHQRKTYREIMEAKGWASTNAVHDVVMKLRRLYCVNGPPRNATVGQEGIARLRQAGLLGSDAESEPSLGGCESRPVEL